jgi:glycosyltransferase involved in cell wall biosynthesis
MRVALLTNIPAPYRIPVYEALAATPGWELRIFVSASSEFDRSWGMESCDLDIERVAGLAVLGRNRTRGPIAVEQVVTRHLPLGLLGALRRFAPHVVVSSELGPRTWLALLYCTLFRIPLVMWSYHSRVSASAAGPVRQALRRLLLARAQVVIGMGTQARQVLVGLGVPGDRIFDAPNAHDRDGLERALAGVDADEQLAELAEELEGRKRIALVAGRLIEAKGIAPLLAAWNRLPESLRSDWTLLFVGSGPLAAKVQSESAGRPPGEIAWIPSVQPDELIGFYAAARLLVFPTLSEPWGLVVNEAFACGRPVVCSIHAGCADDLMRPGENGWLTDPTDPKAFARILEEALTSPDLDRLGACARARVERFGPQVMADGMRRAVASAVAGYPYA